MMLWSPSSSLPRLLYLLILLEIHTTASTSTDIPTFTIDELLTHARKEELEKTLSSTGLLAVRWEEANDSITATDCVTNRRHVAFQGLCDCYDHPDFLNMDVMKGQTRSMQLPDEATVRTSVATATVGMYHPLPLPEALNEVCGQDTVEAMEGLRDSLSDVSKAFVASLGALLMESTNPDVPLLKDSHGGRTYSTLKSIVDSANHLEHFHVYAKEGTNMVNQQQNETVPAAWDWHTDAGLFLVFVPAWNCRDGIDSIDSSFWYKNAQGNSVQAHFDGSRSAVVMLGQGAQDWLDLTSQSYRQSLQLKATVHSVRWDRMHPLKQSASLRVERAWYGMMFLVPETAMIYGTKTLKQVQSSLSLSDRSQNPHAAEQQIVDSMNSLGCGVPELTFNRLSHQPLWASKRRRLQHQDPSACNNVTNFFCWMQCMEIPDADMAQGYVNEGYSLYCLDPAILAASGNRVSEAAAPCKDGFVHNANCLGSWQPTAPGVPAANVNHTADASDIDQRFCYGGTTMYMDGFHFFQSTTCVILLFQSWVLDTAWKYGLAFLGTLVVGMCLEKIIQQRRKIMGILGPGRKRLVVSATFYGIQLTIGYMIMLVIMIYAGALFISTVLGLVIGHVCFNAKDAIFPLKSTVTTSMIPVPENSTDDGSDCEGIVADRDVVDTSGQTEGVSVANHVVGRNTELPPQQSSGLEMDGIMISHDDFLFAGIPCYGKKKGGDVNGTTTPQEQLIPEGATPCCQYNSCE